MSSYALSPELGQIGDDSDRKFRRLLMILAVPALVAGLVIPFVKITSLLQERLQPQRYAKLIQQKPEPPKPVEEKKPEPEKPKPQLTQEQKVERAREKAKKAMKQFDELAALRDADLPTVSQQMSANVITSSGNRVSFAATAGKGSGGIGEVGVVEHGRSTTGLGSRNTTGVKSNIGGRGEGMGKIVKGRTLEEIQLVFDRTKGAFYTMYVREQRQRPDMAGKVTVRLTIAPDGSVKSCRVISSELNHPEFEKKVVARVLLMDFGAKDVGDFTIDYPILFFPS